MNDIKNVWGEINKDFEKNDITALDILIKQSEAINKDIEKTNILSSVFTLSVTDNGELKKVKHILSLLPKNGNDYNYKLIEILNNVDGNYPVRVHAFQNSLTDYGECDNEEQLYEKLAEIFKDPRLKIVFEQLRNIGNSIATWRNENI